MKKRLAIFVAVGLVVGLAATLFVPRNTKATGFDTSIFNRQDFIYGTQIGAWDTNGGTVLTNGTANSNFQAAKSHLVRWGAWRKFSDMDEGQTYSMNRQDFDDAIDGIRSSGATPLIELPPIWNEQCDGEVDYWTLNWLKEIVAQAGDRVQLYEFGNEPDHYCGWSASTYATKWNDTVPALKKYARGLGFEIYVGGPSLTNTDENAVDYIDDWLGAVKTAYNNDSHDPDYIPSFVSTHTYINSSIDPDLSDILDRIDYWGGIYDDIRTTIDTVWSGVTDGNGKAVGPQIKVADSEYNYTIDNGDTRDSNSSFMDSYEHAMLDMLREHHLWAGVLFTIASHGGGALDMLNSNGTTKPLYDAFTDKSLADPLNVQYLTAPVYINSGGSAYTDAYGNSWKADFGAWGGSTDNNGSGHAIANTTKDTMYESERTGAFTYNLPLANGDYRLRLHFAEVTGGSQSNGARVFNVGVNGTSWLSNFDVYAKVGGYTADVEEKDVTVTNGNLSVAFTAVTGSPQVAAIEVLPPAVNLLSNAGFETDANSDSQSDCWDRSGWGTNTPTWTRLNGSVHAGSYAEKVEVASYTDGDRTIASSQGNSACEVKATPGKTYTESMWYKSDRPVRMYFYYKSGGSWSWAGQSPEFAAAGSWTKATWTTPVAPSGATAVGVAAAIAGNGYMSVDDFSLVLDSVTPAVVDTTVTTQQSHPGGYTITSPSFSTAEANEVLYAFIAQSGDPDMDVTAVSGGGLTWTQVAQANTNPGAAEIWRAVATSTLSSQTVTATRDDSTVGAITVVAFKGADTAVTGASGTAYHSTNAPSVSLTTTRPNSLVWGTGNDWDGNTARTVGSLQTMVDEYLDGTWGDTYWVQRLNDPVAASGTSASLSDSAPTNHRWNYAAVEVLAAP